MNILAVGAHIGDAELMAGPLVIEEILTGGQASLLALTPGELGNEKNDPVAMRILDDAAEKLGEAAATLSRVINQDCVIFSGESLELHPKFLSKISEKFRGRTMSINAHVRIIEGNLGNQAAALGGVALILGQVK